MIDNGIITILIALLINVPTWYMLRSNKRKVDADADSGNVKTALELREEMKEDRAEYRSEVQELKARIAALEKSEAAKDIRIAELEAQTKQLIDENATKDRVILSLRVELDTLKRQHGVGYQP